MNGVFGFLQMSGTEIWQAMSETADRNTRVSVSSAVLFLALFAGRLNAASPVKLEHLQDPKGADVLHLGEIVSPAKTGHAVQIDVHMKGSGNLILIVGDGNDAYACDPVAWAEPHFTGSQGENCLRGAAGPGNPAWACQDRSVLH